MAVSGAWVLPGGTAFYLYGNEVGEVLESPFVERFLDLDWAGENDDLPKVFKEKT